MDNHFEIGLEDLRQKLLLMASRAESAVNDSVQALMQRNYDLAMKVRADDDIIDAFEIEIDEMAIQLLTKAPLASNLRLVTVAMKVSQNLSALAMRRPKSPNARAIWRRNAGENRPGPARLRHGAGDGQGRAGFVCAA